MSKLKVSTKTIEVKTAATEFLAIGYSTQDNYWITGVNKATKAKAFEDLMFDNSYLTNCFILELPKQGKNKQDLSHIPVIKVA